MKRITHLLFSGFAKFQSPSKVQFLYEELYRCTTIGDINRLKQLALHNLDKFKPGVFVKFQEQVDHRLTVIEFSKRFHGFVFTTAEIAEMFNVAKTVAECDGLLLNILNNRQAYAQFGRDDLTIYQRMAEKRISKLLCAKSKSL